MQFVGIDVWEDDKDAVKSFLDEMGDKMDYNVAVIDSVSEGGDPNAGVMAKKWLKAADENGIPTAFVVHDGKIAWIGHPMELEKPLQKDLDGKWDIAESAKKRLAEKIDGA